jgi:hypothetical protein
MPARAAHASLAALSKARRAELAASWPVETSDLSARRAAGAALGVYDDTRDRWCTPSFQFIGTDLIAQMTEILVLLRKDGHRHPSGWGEIEWFLSFHVLLDGRSPAEVLPEDPQTVLEAARVEFLEEDAAGGF